jgi:hypothetical protein
MNPVLKFGRYMLACTLLALGVVCCAIGECLDAVSRRISASRSRLP